MNRVLLLVLAFYLLFLPAARSESLPARDNSYQPVTGLEWMELSAGERVEYLLAAMYLLNKNGVEFSGTEDRYYDAIYKKLQSDPGLYTSQLEDILANTIYEKEPKTRSALDQFRIKGKTGSK